MATLSIRNPTLLDYAQAQDANGKIAKIIEILKQTNEILEDMTWMEANGITAHTTTIRSGIPAPTWKKFYGGIQPNKATNVKVNDTMGMLRALAEVDVDLADLNNNTAAFRMSEDRAHLQGMSNEMAESLFFASETTSPEEFTGFAPRFNSLSAENADNILDAAGTGVDNTSIWLVVWGPDTVHGIFPKGSTSGLRVEDKGKIMLDDASDGSNTGRLEVYSTMYKWDAGLSVRDWRYVVRICNIDKSQLTADAATGADLADLMFQAMELIPAMNAGRAAFYLSRTSRTFLRRQLANARSMSTLQLSEVGGVPVTKFQGISLRRCDILSADESRVT